MSDRELALYEVLSHAAAKMNLLVLPRVTMSAVFESLPAATDDAAAFVNFLVVSRDGLKVIAGVHCERRQPLPSADQAATDIKVNLFRAAKLPLLRLYPMSAYSEEEMLARFEDAMGVQPLQ